MDKENTKTTDSLDEALSALNTASAALRRKAAALTTSGGPVDEAQRCLTLVREVEEKAKQVQAVQKRLAPPAK
jgi:uncharacterized protein involved in exopolysaccharide biosynthesis